MFAGFRVCVCVLWQCVVSLVQSGFAIHAAVIDARDALLAAIGLPELSLGLLAGLCTLLCGENLIPCDVNQVALPRLVRAHRAVAEHVVGQADLMLPARRFFLPGVSGESLSALALPAMLFGAADALTGWAALGLTALAFGGLAMLAAWLTLRYIPNHNVGVVEKLWSASGSVPEGAILALNGEAGYQSELLRGGVHFGLWRWQYRVHRARLVTVPQGKIGYVYARDGEPLAPSQTLGRVVECSNFQDARAFLREVAHSQSRVAEPSTNASQERQPGGQRGRQRAILREGVYAINPALFVVITEDDVFALRSMATRQELIVYSGWQEELRDLGGFSPLVVGQMMPAVDPLHPEQQVFVDSIGIVTVHDGPTLPPGEIIAPAVGNEPGAAGYHNSFQDPEEFLAAGGRRGRQYLPLTDGTYFINRWFATVMLIPKTVVPIGHVGVVVSYYGRTGRDLSGDAFRHGERVAEGERGVWERPLGPGKYAFNTFAGSVVLVPTTNFVLHWITGKSESHRFDESLRSIDLVTRDAYEPLLPLSVVVHIDYQRAPNVIQRFGDVKKLITQTLDPMLSAYFRDIAHKKTMLELLHDRDLIQAEARGELLKKFREFDIECVDVLIGKPDTTERDSKIEGLLEQLRLRQLSIEQMETFDRQRAASEKLKALHDAQALAQMQTELTNARVQVQIAESKGEADLARSRKQAEQSIVMAEADLARARRQAEQKVVLAEAESREKVLAGRGESQKVMQIGLSEASVLLRKIASFGDPRLYALLQAAERLASSQQPLVPERMFVTAGDGASGAGHSLIGQLLSLLVAEKSGFQPADFAELTSLKEFSDRLAREAAESLRAPMNGAAAKN